MMVGRDIDEFYPPKAKRRDGNIMLQCSGLSRKDKFEDISFDVREGEIQGFMDLLVRAERKWPYPWWARTRSTAAQPNLTACPRARSLGRLSKVDLLSF